MCENFLHDAKLEEENVKSLNIIGQLWDKIDNQSNFNGL